jgi:hypothetical protein
MTTLALVLLGYGDNKTEVGFYQTVMCGLIAFLMRPISSTLPGVSEAYFTSPVNTFQDSVIRGGDGLGDL